MKGDYNHAVSSFLTPSSTSGGNIFFIPSIHPSFIGSDEGVSARFHLNTLQTADRRARGAAAQAARTMDTDADATKQRPRSFLPSLARSLGPSVVRLSVRLSLTVSVAEQGRKEGRKE